MFSEKERDYLMTQHLARIGTAFKECRARCRSSRSQFRWRILLCRWDETPKDQEIQKCHRESEGRIGY